MKAAEAPADAEARGTVVGMLRYEDGAPATGVRIGLGYDAQVAVHTKALSASRARRLAPGVFSSSQGSTSAGYGPPCPVQWILEWE
jgi:hypothetical protein